jgi:hypothetical protein
MLLDLQQLTSTIYLATSHATATVTATATATATSFFCSVDANAGASLAPRANEGDGVELLRRGGEANEEGGQIEC